MQVNLRIFSWNYGETSKLKERSMFKLINQEFTKSQNNIHIFVIGLQEVHSSQAEYLGMYLKKAMDHFGYDGTIYQQGKGDFNLLTGVFMQPFLQFINFEEKHLYLAANTTFTNKVLSGIIKTKGALSVKINVINTITGERLSFIFVNVHLPFHSADHTRASVNKVLRQYAWSGDNIIMFGDFNSRSLYNDECDIRNKKVCEGVSYVKNVPKESVVQLEKHLNTCRRVKYESDSVLRREYDLRKHQCHDLSKNLQNNDLLVRENMINSNDFSELRLFSLPSYKINPEDGVYSLQKGRHGRLAGFADRIIFRGYFEASDYKMLPYTGNDHYPIMLSVSTSEKFTPDN